MIPCPYSLNRPAHLSDLVDVQIVDDDGVTGPEHRGQGVGDIGLEPHTVRRPVEDGLGYLPT